MSFTKGDKVILNKDGLDVYPAFAGKVLTVERSEGAVIVLESNHYISAIFLDLAQLEAVDTAPVITDATLKLAMTVSSSVEDDPQFYVMSVEFSTEKNENLLAGYQGDPRSSKQLGTHQHRSKSNRRYEYLAFGMYDELVAATHAVVSHAEHQDIDDLLNDTSLQVVRVLDVYPTSQQRYDGKLKYIVDFVDGAEFVRKNMREKQTSQLKRDLKAHLEKITQMNSLRDAVQKSNDPKAAELLAQLEELEKNG